jgi:hypothetical protein
MRNVTIQLTIDRHRSNGSAQLKGRVDNKDVSLSVSRGTTDATAYVNGNWGSDDQVQLAFNRDVHQGYNRIDGEMDGHDIHATLNRGLDGDTDMRMGGGRFEVDRDQKGENVAIRGTDVRGRVERELREGDEQGELTLDGERVRFSIDRDPLSGDFNIAGRSPGGRFELQAKRQESDGDLELTGTLPEGSQMFPLFWEILGDDKNIPDRNPLYPGSLVGMSLFFDHKSDQQ